MEHRLGGGLAADYVREPLGHLTVSRDWLTLRNVWLAARDVWDLGDQQAAAENVAPDAEALKKAFAPIVAYHPKTALEWAEKVGLADYRGHLSGQGIAAALWSDAALIGIQAADRRVMSKGGQAAAVVAALSHPRRSSVPARRAPGRQSSRNRRFAGLGRNHPDYFRRKK